MNLEQEIKLVKKQLNGLNRVRSHVTQLTTKCKNCRFSYNKR